MGFITKCYNGHKIFIEEDELDGCLIECPICEESFYAYQSEITEDPYPNSTLYQRSLKYLNLYGGIILVCFGLFFFIITYNVVIHIISGTLIIIGSFWLLRAFFLAGWNRDIFSLIRYVVYILRRNVNKRLYTRPYKSKIKHEKNKLNKNPLK